MAALVAAWRPESVFAGGEVPLAPSTPYNVVSASSGSAENYSLSAQFGSRSYRIAVQAFGETAGEVDFAVAKADAAFLDKKLTVTGWDLTTAQVEAASPLLRDTDIGELLYKTVTYTLTAYPTE
ncbi:hypothetical protein [Aeromicrobium sp. 9AM]|uniref:hypothetical protein n=1 Tax=Aeromicrobium sp. 9AM TaxID=2653126 RepID=UPI001357DD57|nr:hypothetical protein [Aeromicrobium sp. 9AM]